MERFSEWENSRFIGQHPSAVKNGRTCKVRHVGRRLRKNILDVVVKTCYSLSTSIEDCKSMTNTTKIDLCPTEK